MRGRQYTTFFEATITLEEPLFRPGDGRIEYGWDRHSFYEQEVMPRFRFEGRVNRKEGRQAADDWQPLAGVGYGEHTLTNDFPFEVAQRFQGFRALRPDGLSIVYDGLVTAEGHGGRTLGWTRVALDGATLFEGHEVSFVPTNVVDYEAGGVHYALPQGYEFVARDGPDYVRVRVRNAELVSSESPFARIGAFLRAMLGAMMSPYDFELGVDYDAWVHIGGHTAHVSGRGWSSTSITR